MKLAPVMPLVLAAICAWNTSFGLAQQFSVTIEVPEVFLLGCEFSADGRLFATGGDCIRVFHADSGTPVQHFRPTLRPRKTDPIRVSFDDHKDVGKFIDFDAYKFYSRAFAFSPVARGVIAAGCDDGSLVIWNATTLQTLPLEGHRGAIEKIAFSPDGVLLASVGQRQHHTGKILGELRLWNTQTGELMRS